MDPQTSNQPQNNQNQSAPVAQPVATPPQPPTSAKPVGDIVTKKIHNAGQSTFLLGILMTILALISLLGVKSLEQSKQTLSYGFLGLVAVFGIYWVVAGAKIKKTTDAQTAVRLIQMVAVSGLVVFVLTLVGMAIKPGGGGLAGILALILAIYLFVAESGIKKAK